MSTTGATLALSAATISSPVVVGSLLVGADEAVSEMVRDKIPHIREKGFGPCVAIGIVRRAVLVGGVVFNNNRGFDIHLSAAFWGPGWALPQTIRAIAAYPFDQLDVKRVTSITGRKNKRARKTLLALGFREVGVAHLGLDGFEDAFIFEMLKENCKWLKDRDHGLNTRSTCCA